MFKDIVIERGMEMKTEVKDKIIAKEYNVEAIKFILENAKSVFETERSIVKNNMYINLARFNQALNNKTISGIENVWIIERPYNIEKMEMTFLIKGDFDRINFDKVVEILKFDEIAIFVFHDFDNEFFIDIDSEVDDQILEDILHQKLYKLY